MIFQHYTIRTISIITAYPDGSIMAAHPVGLTIAPGDCITVQSFGGTGAIGFLRTWDVTPDGYPVHVRPDAHYRVEYVSDEDGTVLLHHDPRVTVEYLGNGGGPAVPMQHDPRIPLGFLDEDDGYPD
ncbi:MAG: hypothetical protein EBT79_02430 [Actinobacteria bacterium]|nr:hypothetical protein [Actinomycetota bacterium]NBR66132.1 hypothetical protein [Actinomycetota bacterium]